MSLKAIKPKIIKPSKPKVMITGVPGVGKSFFATKFPSPYYMDHEEGATREQFQNNLEKSNGVYFSKNDGAEDIRNVIEEIKSLAITKHNYKTLVLDTWSKLYEIELANQEMRVGNNYGIHKAETNKFARQVVLWCKRLDMAVLFLCHSKEKWSGTGNDRSIVGTTFEGYDKMDKDLDLWLEMFKSGKERFLKVRKSRIDKFPEDMIIKAEYLDFANLYGKEIIESEPVKIELATAEQIELINDLVNKCGISQDQQTEWLKKVEADKFSEAPKESLQRLIDYLLNKGGK